MNKKYRNTINTSDMVVSTIQSVDTIDTTKFSLIILDEVHCFL